MTDHEHAEPGQEPTAPARAERSERAARNQSLFREVNERINDVNTSFDPATGVFQIVCECADPSCTDQLELLTEAYEAVRAHPNRFIVERGHVYPDAERVVEARDGHVIVEKFEPGAQIARATDPRARSS